RQHHEIDQECKHPPCQHTAKQFRLQIGVERMRLYAAATRVPRTAIRHDQSSRPHIPASRDMGTAAPRARAAMVTKRQYSGDSGAMDLPTDRRVENEVARF